MNQLKKYFLVLSLSFLFGLILLVQSYKINQMQKMMPYEIESSECENKKWCPTRKCSYDENKFCMLIVPEESFSGKNGTGLVIND